MAQHIRSFTHAQLQLNYLLSIPSGTDNTQRWPLIIFLHGIGERGSDPEQLKVHGIPRIVEERPDFPFVTVSPQCPPGTLWPMHVEPLAALVEQSLLIYPVDPHRVYLMGMSMGGYGAWSLAIAHPQRFAAMAVVAGGGDPTHVCAMKDVPVWVFHGGKDSTVLPREAEKMVEALKACGGKVRYSLYPQAGHDSWTRTFARDDLYEWLLKHSRA